VIVPAAAPLVVGPLPVDTIDTVVIIAVVAAVHHLRHHAAVVDLLVLLPGPLLLPMKGIITIITIEVVDGPPEVDRHPQPKGIESGHAVDLVVLLEAIVITTMLLLLPVALPVAVEPIEDDHYPVMEDIHLLLIIGLRMIFTCVIYLDIHYLLDLLEVSLYIIYYFLSY
jgi:hypothetical protein